MSSPRDRDGTTLGAGQTRALPTDEATQAAARRTAARLAIRNDPRAANDDLVIATAEVLDALGLFPGVPDRPAQRRGRPIPDLLDPSARRSR